MARWFTQSKTTAALLVTFLNSENIPYHKVVAIVHDGTNFIVFYHR